MRQTKPMLTDEQWARIEPLFPKDEQVLRRGSPPIGNREAQDRAGELYYCGSGMFHPAD